MNRETKIVRYAYRNKTEMAQMIRMVDDLVETIEKIKPQNAETMLYYLQNVLDFIEPEDLGLTDWN